ncbi:MAG: Ppx/GppA family phosphatase, partial [Prosthecochloris sp.]|nr:Ppx/GppA family phosphatase [Prosthecochloris sp.]
IPEGRADVITMGALILHQFMKLLGTESIRVSIQGLRYGMAWKELQKLVSDGETTNSA